MNIYGITYDHTTNYGSCFQAFALKRAIEGIEISKEGCKYSLIPIRAFKDWPGKRRFNPLTSFHRLRFFPFEKQYMKFAGVNRLCDLSSLNQDADAFVCGSDVIWNPKTNFLLKAFFLDFATCYKFSYAASFGTAEISDDYVKSVKDSISSLDSISCREPSGCSIISQMGESARVVVDPILLLDNREWNGIIDKEHRNDKYIFVYVTHYTDEVAKFVANLKNTTGLRVTTTAWNTSPRVLLKHGILQVKTPKKWLQLLRDAEYVVTNSFHATAFSVLFHKKFFTVVSGEKDKGINIRMDDFLRTIGLGGRIYNTVPETLDLSEIDYTDADRIIEKMRADSMDYLKRNLQAAYEQKLRSEAKEPV